MGHRKLQHTFLREGNYVFQLRLKNGKIFKKALRTDSYREARAVMIAFLPYIDSIRAMEMPLERAVIALDALISSKHSNVPPVIITPPDAIQTLSLEEAWRAYKEEKGTAWTKAIALANERYIEVLMSVLGGASDIATISRKDIKQVMEVVEGLPRRVIQPYRAMNIEQLIAYDVPEEDLIGTEAVHKHLKIYKSLFKTFLTDDKEILSSSPTDGVIAPPSSSRYGAYSNMEMRLFVTYALKEEKEEWIKWIILLLAYTGARRGEIATLESSQLLYDVECERYYLLIREGKTDNAVRQVPVHQHLINLGFIEFVKGKKGKLFPVVSGSNMAKVGKTLSDIRDALNIPYMDIHNQRRIVHSFRHSVITSASAWMNDITYLQQVVGHEKTGTGITRRYLHTYPLSTILHIIDGLDWIN